MIQKYFHRNVSLIWTHYENDENSRKLLTLKVAPNIIQLIIIDNNWSTFHAWFHEDWINNVCWLILKICEIRFWRNYFFKKSTKTQKPKSIKTNWNVMVNDFSSNWNVGYNFAPCQEVEPKKGNNFFQCETWSINYEWYWETAITSCADTLYFRFVAEKLFCMKILLILAQFQEKTLSRSGDIKSFFQGRRMYMYILPHPFMGKVLSEERQLIKWVGIFQVGISWVVVFRGG